jgi:magnesium-transporting ATPase (P-type)
VETLGSASVVCSDETGTLTQNAMTIQRAVTPSGEIDLTGSGYRPEGELRADGHAIGEGVLLDELRTPIAAGCLANDAALREVDGAWQIQGDRRKAAFLVAEAKIDGLADACRARERVGEIPFTSERKLMTTLQADAEHGRAVAAVTKGAPDELLARCAAERVAGTVCATHAAAARRHPGHG